MKKFFQDPSGVFFFILEIFRLNLLRIFSSSYMKIGMTLRGIKYGQGCNFYGRAFFRRYYKSSIVIGSGCRFRSSVISNYIGLNRPCFISTFSENAKIILGSNVGLSGTVIGCAEYISIGNNVLLGGNTLITDFDWHPLYIENRRLDISRPVMIEDDVFIGVNAIILKGAQIGKGSIIGANSVVTSIIPPFSIAAGNPCRVVNKIV